MGPLLRGRRLLCRSAEIGHAPGWIWRLSWVPLGNDARPGRGGLLGGAVGEFPPPLGESPLARPVLLPVAASCRPFFRHVRTAVPGTDWRQARVSPSVRRFLAVAHVCRIPPLRRSEPHRLDSGAVRCRLLARHVGAFLLTTSQGPSCAAAHGRVRPCSRAIGADCRMALPISPRRESLPGRPGCLSVASGCAGAGHTSTAFPHAFL